MLRNHFRLLDARDHPALHAAIPAQIDFDDKNEFTVTIEMSRELDQVDLFCARCRVQIESMPAAHSLRREHRHGK
jgi:hypothetical protein